MPAAPARGQGLRPGADYAPIVDGLYMGGRVKAPPPLTTAVLNLTFLPDPYRCEVHAWMPILDSAPAPGLAWLRKAVDWIEEQRQCGRTTYVHCRRGVSRSSLVVTAYLMRKYDLPLDQALALVRRQRPAANPNRAFMALLRRWERELRPGCERP